MDEYPQPTPQPQPTPRPDARRERGRRTRDAVLDTAVALASVDGLDGLSLARLADALGVSKSGLFAHWRDKQQLQLDTIERATRQWQQRVIGPAAAAPEGVRRVWALHEARLAFYRDGTLPGGCFFYTAQSEFDDRPGPVHDRVARAEADWVGFIASTVQQAIDRGELAGVEADQLAFEIEALGEAVIPQSRLLDRDLVYARARRAVLDRLRALATNPDLLPAE
jgi:AcrR family transcriptional regulator